MASPAVALTLLAVASLAVGWTVAALAEAWALWQLAQEEPVAQCQPLRDRLDVLELALVERRQERQRPLRRSA